MDRDPAASLWDETQIYIAGRNPTTDHLTPGYGKSGPNQSLWGDTHLYVAGRNPTTDHLTPGDGKSGLIEKFLVGPAPKTRPQAERPPVKGSLSES